MEDRLKAIVDEIAYPGLVLEINIEGQDGRYFLRWSELNATCNITGRDYGKSNGRWWRLSPHMTDGEVVGTAFLALQTFIEHETRERFTFRGVPVYDSHTDIHKLVALRRDPASVTGRPDFIGGRPNARG